MSGWRSRLPVGQHLTATAPQNGEEIARCFRVAEEHLYAARLPENVEGLLPCGQRLEKLRKRKAGEKQPHHLRRRVNYSAWAVTDEREPVVFVISGSRGKARAHRIVRNVTEGTLKLPQVCDNKTFEAIVPHMAVDAVMAIKPHGETTQYPLHYARKRFLIAWTKHEVNVILHDADIYDGEVELCPRSNEDPNKDRFHYIRAEDELPTICPSDNMVRGTFDYSSRFSHTLGYARFAAVDCIFCGNSSKSQR